MSPLSATTQQYIFINKWHYYYVWMWRISAFFSPIWTPLKVRPLKRVNPILLWALGALLQFNFIGLTAAPVKVLYLSSYMFFFGKFLVSFCTVAALSLHVHSEGEECVQVPAMWEKTSKEVWEFDVSLRQGYVTIWAAMAMIRLKYKVFW